MRLERSEAEIARAVVQELASQGFDTYEEVSTGYGGQRADIVAVRGPEIMVVETKQTVSLALLNQLLDWRGRAHRIVGAVGGGKCRGAVEQFCRAEGFGLWFVGFEIDEVVAPRLHRRLGDYMTARLRKRLVPENRTGTAYAPAGTNRGGYYTPFRRTAHDLVNLVKAEPGISLRDALAKVPHHYASTRSAVSALPGCIERGLIPGIAMERVGRQIRLVPLSS